MSACIVTAEVFDAFLKCESKAYFKSSEQIGDSVTSSGNVHFEWHLR